MTILLEDDLVSVDPETGAPWSNREIARRCAVSADLVDRLRPIVCPKQADAPRTVSRGGNVYTMDTAAIGRKPIETTPEIPADEPAPAEPQAEAEPPAATNVVPLVPRLPELPTPSSALSWKVTQWNERVARRWEIAENLHRAELTKLERTEQIAEWINLTEKAAKEAAEKVSSQVATKPKGGRPSVGVRAAARELGVDKDDRLDGNVDRGTGRDLPRRIGAARTRPDHDRLGHRRLRDGDGGRNAGGDRRGGGRDAR